MYVVLIYQERLTIDTPLPLALLQIICILLSHVLVTRINRSSKILKLQYHLRCYIKFKIFPLYETQES